MLMYTVCKIPAANSLLQSYNENDFVLVKRHFSQPYTSGQIVVLRHECLGNIVGRVEKVSGDRLKLASETSAFCDAIKLSWQRVDDVVGRVVFHAAE